MLSLAMDQQWRQEQLRVKALDKVVDKGKKIDAHLLEAAEADIEFKDGTFSVAGTDKSVSFGDVALKAYIPHQYPIEELEPGLEETAFYDPANFTYPAGAYACEVEVDPDTGKVTICSFAAADDFGNVINPMIVEGQVHGGLAQGIGQALLEGCTYDENGQILSASYMDYAMPRADDLHVHPLPGGQRAPRGRTRGLGRVLGGELRQLGTWVTH